MSRSSPMPVLAAFLGATLSLTATSSAQSVIRRESVDSSGAQSNGSSSTPSLSRNGRWVAFVSWASDLVPGDTNGTRDVFLRDRSNGTIRRVTELPDGTEANGMSDAPYVSATGEFVVYHSDATNLVPGDTNGWTDILLYDLQTGTTTLVSTAADGSQGDLFSVKPSVSADGRWVAFESHARNLVSGDTNNVSDVFVKDMVTGAVTRASVDANGAQANSLSYLALITEEGDKVCFGSLASNLVPGDTNGQGDMFRHDRTSGAVELISVDSSGGQSSGFCQSSGNSFASSDGNFVIFTAFGDDLDPADTNGFPDCYLRDIAAGTTERVSVTSTGVQGDDWSDNGCISEDGSTALFRTAASNLMAGDDGQFVNACTATRDPVGGWNFSGADVSDQGAQANDDCSSPSLSDDGAHAAFASWATNLVPGDTNNEQDVFVRGANLGLEIYPLKVWPGNNVSMICWGATPFFQYVLFLWTINDLLNPIRLYIGPTDSKGRDELTFTVPNDPALSGLRTTWSALSNDAVRGVLAFTAPAKLDFE